MYNTYVLMMSMTMVNAMEWSMGFNFLCMYIYFNHSVVSLLEPALLRLRLSLQPLVFSLEASIHNSHRSSCADDAIYIRSREREDLMVLWQLLNWTSCSLLGCWISWSIHQRQSTKQAKVSSCMCFNLLIEKAHIIYMLVLPCLKQPASALTLSL